MAKLRGRKRWKRFDVWCELMALEVKLDSLHQKATLNDGSLNLSEKEISWLLGAVRSIQSRVGQEQKTLKRWLKPAPNQLEEYKLMRQQISSLLRTKLKETKDSTNST